MFKETGPSANWTHHQPAGQDQPSHTTPSLPPPPAHTASAMFPTALPADVGFLDQSLERKHQKQG